MSDPRSFRFAGILIAALAAGPTASIWSLDRDFTHMAPLGFVEIHRPSTS